MNTQAHVATWLTIGLFSCAHPNDSECEFIGYDFYNTTERGLRITTIGDTHPHLHTDVFGQPVEFYAVLVCDNRPPKPGAFPEFLAKDIEQNQSFLLDLDPSDWSRRRRDPMRGYDYFRAQIDEDDLLPML